MPRQLFAALFIAIGMPLGFLVLSLSLLITQLAAVTPPTLTLLAIKNCSVLAQRVLFNPLIVIIQCELLKLFPVLSVRVTKARVNIFRMVFLAIYAISAFFIVAGPQGLGLIQSNIGENLDFAFSLFGFLFDLFVALWLLQHLIRIKKVNVKTSGASSCIVIICLIPCLGFYQLYSLFTLRFEFYLSLGPLNVLALLTQVPVTISFHYSLLVELFVHCRALAIAPSKNQIDSARYDDRASGLPRLLDVVVQQQSKPSEKSTFKEKETIRRAKFTDE